MFRLNTNRRQGDVRILSRICLIAAAHLVHRVLAEVVDDFAIEHSVLIQVHKLRLRRRSQLLIFGDFAKCLLVSACWGFEILPLFKLGQLLLVASNICLSILHCRSRGCSTGLQLSELSL